VDETDDVAIGADRRGHVGAVLIEWRERASSSSESALKIIGALP